MASAIQGLTVAESMLIIWARMSETVEIAMSERARAVWPGLTPTIDMSAHGHRLSRFHRAWHGSCMASGWLR
jgi:hypothetical protein